QQDFQGPQRVLFLRASSAPQTLCIGQVTTYDQRPAAVAKFLSGADPWIIADAKCDGGIVVSHESRLDQTALTPKIPNVYHAFGVGCITLPAMLKALKFRFGGKA